MGLAPYPLNSASSTVRVLAAEELDVAEVTLVLVVEDEVPGEELVVLTLPDEVVLLLPVEEGVELEDVALVGEDVVAVVGKVVGAVVPVVVVVARNKAAAAAITMITTMTTAITIRLIASALKALFFLGLGEDTKFAMTIALFSSCYHSDA